MPLSPNTGTVGYVNPNPINITWDRGQPMPDPIAITVSSSNAEFVEASISRPGTAVKWFAPDGITDDYFYLNDFSITQDLIINFQNFDQLINNNYSGFIQFRFTKTDEIDKYVNVAINLTITGDAGPKTDKLKYDLIYNKTNGQLSGDLHVGILNNMTAAPLSLWSSNPSINPVTGFTDGFDISESTSNPMSTNPDFVIGSTVTSACRILNASGVPLAQFDIVIAVVDSNITAVPNRLDFEILLDNHTEASQILKLINPTNLNFSITQKPSWLSLSATSGNSTQDITVTTVSGLLSPGLLSGTITVAFNSTTIDIPVSILVKKFAQISTIENFCLDFPPIIFTKITDSARFVKIAVTATYVVMGVTSVVSKLFIAPYVNDAATFDLGEKLHKLFPRHKKSMFAENTAEFMKIISADLQFDEVDADYVSVFSQTASGIKLFPGKKPDGYPLLSSTLFRKTNEGSIWFTNQVQADTVVFSKIENNPATTISFGPKTLTLYEFPQVFKPLHLQWENQNLAYEWFTFTGEYKISNDYSQMYARDIFKSQNEKYDASKVRLLQVNTGFILAKERNLIDEIILSKIAFIKIGEKIYRCFNITTKAVHEDSTAENIQYDLEFLIAE